MGCEKTLHLELAGEAIAPALDPQHPRIRGRRSLAAQLTPGSGRGGPSVGERREYDFSGHHPHAGDRHPKEGHRDIAPGHPELGI